MHEASVTSLAILKVNSDSGQDYIENFVPFVSEAVRRAPQDEISVIEVQSVIKDEFGLVIPQGALVTLLNRAERKGIVRRANRIYVRNGAAIDPSFERNRAEFSRQYQALLQKLIDFCLSEHNVTLTRAQADDALLAHLQVACIPILAASVDGCPITPPSDSVRHSEFLVNSFIVELYEGDPVGFGFLETVMKGSMLATALFLPELAQAKRKFDKLTVYLDTQLLLRALGLDGGTQEAATKELLTLLYELNITLACFDSTRNELQSVLEAAQNALRDTRQSTRQFGVYKYFLEKNQMRVMSS